jgi:hypothetical protein
MRHLEDIAAEIDLAASRHRGEASRGFRLDVSRKQHPRARHTSVAVDGDRDHEGEVVVAA